MAYSLVDRAQVLAEALPYIQKYSGKTIVVTEQDIAADTQVEIGSVIEVTFHDTTVLD